MGIKKAELESMVHHRSVVKNDCYLDRRERSGAKEGAKNGEQEEERAVVRVASDSRFPGRAQLKKDHYMAVYYYLYN